MKVNGFEPSYSYYKTGDAIVIKIEAPGKCNVESYFQFSGEYVIIKKCYFSIRRELENKY